jgi:hypothetical protein
MRGIVMPFGCERRGRAATWPAWAGPEREAGPPRRPADPWLENEEPFTGGTALEDLRLAEDAADAARILAAYLTVRLVVSAVRPPPGFQPDVERLAARSCLALLPETDPDRLNLARLVDRAGRGLPDSGFVRGIDAVAAGAAHRSWRRMAFSLLHAAYTILRPRGRHSDAALLARRLAQVAGDGGSNAAARRWNLRAAAHERRAAAE